MIYHLFQERYHRTLAISVAILLCMMYGGAVFVGCEGSSATSGSYVYTDITQVEFLTWKESSGTGQITGQWNTVSYQLPVSRKSQPSVSPLITLSGTVNGQALQLSGDTFSFNGIISDNTLKTHRPTSSGQLVDQTWVPASQQEYDDLIAAFNTYMPLQGALTDLSNITKYPLDNSNPSSLNDALMQAQNYVKQLKDRVRNMQVAPTHAAQCQQIDLLSQYYPVAPETFQLPYEPDQSTLAQDLAAIQSLWKQAQRQYSHDVAGLKPPWIISQVNLHKALAPGQQAYMTLQSTYQKDQQQIVQLRDNDYQQLSNTINSTKQGCP